MFKRKKYSNNEKRSYYIGVGCGYSECNPKNDIGVAKYYNTLSKSEKSSFNVGLKKGYTHKDFTIKKSFKGR